MANENILLEKYKIAINTKQKHAKKKPFDILKR